MKWFQHLTMAADDLKNQLLIDKYGFEGYGLYWFYCELVGREGRNFRLSSGKNWKKIAQKKSGREQKWIDEVSAYMGKLGLISGKALKQGTLHIPKLKRYCDEYTKKVRRMSGQYTNNVREGAIIINNTLINSTFRKDIKVILLYAKYKNITQLSKEQYSSYIKRNIRYAQLLKGYPTLRIGEVMKWLEKNAEFKWTLESVGKYIDEDLKKLEKGEEVVKI